MQLAGSKSEAEVGDEEVCRPALVPAGRGGREEIAVGMDGEGW